jgi:transposase
MQIRSMRLPRSRYLERGAAELSREAEQRLDWFDYYQAHGRKAALTCRYFGISRQTFYRWKRRYDPQNLRTLEEGSHRPHRRRRPTWTAEQAERVRRLSASWRTGARTSWRCWSGARAGRFRSPWWAAS